MLYTYSFKPVLDFMTASELIKMQSLNKYLYENFIPTYFTTSPERKNNLRTLKIDIKLCRQSFLLFEGKSILYRNSLDKRKGHKNTNLKWIESPKALR